MHELPQLGKLEEKYPEELVVIGVQSPKYSAEGIPENLRAAVQRYDIRHPVVDDPDNAVWNAFSVSAWPTLVFISPAGRVIGQHAGEAHFDALDRVMQQIIEEYRREGSLSPGPTSIQVAAFSRPSDQLSFPGKVLAAADRIFISDSDHHRVVVTSPDGIVEEIIGSGDAGLLDGTLDSARFNRPQGVAIDSSGTLYIADSENHAIRAVDWEQRRVVTVAGTGKQAVSRIRRGPATETDLSSPWDVAVEGATVYIAMAGLHQVWSLDLESEVVAVWAGTGHEALRDGPREQAWLAQPMGLTLDQGALYVACAEAQAVRKIDVAGGAVTTLAGRGLFDFGDEAGPAASATLQHCQDVAVLGGTVYVADTYNNRIKSIDQSAAEVANYLGSGQSGVLDGPGDNARFNEPSGLSVHEGILWIADTNNHLIRTCDLQSGHVRTLTISGHGLDVRES